MPPSQIAQPISQTATPDPNQGPPVGTQPKMQIEPQGQDANDPANQQPIELNVKIRALPSEIEDAVSLLRQAGLDDIADTLEKAAKPSDMDQESSALQDEISAMGSSPHGIGGA